MTTTCDILLTTLNARHMHTAFGLRYLLANLGDLQARAEIAEFTIAQRPIDIAEQLLNRRPLIIGIGVYIWNATEVTALVELLRQISPDTIIVLGGPEVSFADDQPAVSELADYVITGAAEKSFADLCRLLLAGQRPLERLIRAEELPLTELVLPYDYYSDEDIRNRLIYVEASRGCPYKCEFCLSALDKTAKPFATDAFLEAMDVLYRRGVRNFKFIDRTFNLKIDTCAAILEFFLERMDDSLYVHFEFIPDRLPERLQQLLARFPAHSIQFEVGVQSFDQDIMQRIQRKQDNARVCENLGWLRKHTHVYLHTDLIFGLPGDTLENFAVSFDRLVALRPHEIQLGILKRLRGAPINRHTDDYAMRYNPAAPYNLLCNRDISFDDMQAVNRFARYWDMIANSGRFKHTLPLILGDAAFANFMQLSQSLYQRSGSTWKIALRRLYSLLFEILAAQDRIDHEQLYQCLQRDYLRNGEKGDFDTLLQATPAGQRSGVANRRQLRSMDN